MLPHLNLYKTHKDFNDQDLTKKYHKYAYDVVNNNIVTNKYIKQACERYISWFSRDDMYFDEEDVDLKIRFMSKIKHVQGACVGEYFDLYPYQAWLTANIIGWKWKEDDTRVINTALLMLARKSGKTFFAAALMLAIILTDKEPGAEGYLIANSTQQASIAFKHASNHCRSLDPSGKLFSKYRSQIKIPLINSSIQILSSDTNKLDGLSPSIFIVDEYAASKTTENFDILRTGQGSRKNPCGIIISSAGFFVGEGYPLYDFWQNALDVLNGTKTQDSLFAAIYQLDVDDDYKDESCWIKANPTLGGSISYKFLREQVQQAVNNSSQEVSIKTKNFNIWCNSEITWIPREDILAHSQKINLLDFDGLYAYVGVDLGSVSDMSAVCYLVVKEDKFYFKTYCYIPEGSIEKSKNRELYRKWIKEGYLKTTSGKRANYDEIVADMIKINEYLPLYEILYDTYNAVTYKQLCEEQGWVMTPFKQTRGAFNLATKEFERNLYLGNIILDDNPVIRWMFSNVELKFDEMENCKPIKGNGGSGKIDGVIAILESFGGYLNQTYNFGTVTLI